VLAKIDATNYNTQWITPASGGVTSFSASTTGLTPNTATTGAITLAGTLIAVNGGTGQSTYAVGDLLVGGATNTLNKLADVATGNALISGGIGVAPSYGKIGLATHVSGTLPIANGGTNSTATATAGGAGYGTGTAHAYTAAGTAGQVLTSNGTSAPTWGAAPAGAAATPSALGTVYAQTGTNITPWRTFFGIGAGAVNTGTRNTFIGTECGNANSTGANNTGLGFNALLINTTGSDNTAVGIRAAQTITTGNDNTAVGSSAMNGTLTGARNTAVGKSSLEGNVTGLNNTAVGFESLKVCDGTSPAGSSNSAFGAFSLQATTTGRNNSAVGYGAGFYLTTGDTNTLLGYFAGSIGTLLSTGSNNTIIGNASASSSASVSNEITLGNSSIATLRCQVTTITALSDARDKKDITPLQAGIEFIKKLNPVNFIWNMRDGGKVDIADAGFIAQELKQAQIDTGITIPNLVFEGNPDKLEAGYGALLPVLVKAIQEQQAQIEELTARITTLESK
jgi:hypothetical protein